MCEELLYSIAGFIIVMLLGVIAFFLQDFVKEVKEFKNAVIALQIAIKSDQISVKGWRESDKEKHVVITKRLDDHGRRLDMHEIEIATIKTKIK